MKKAEMSMTVIVGAAIALLILVIITAILMDSFSNLDNANSCSMVNEQSECIPENDLCGDLGDYTQHNGECQEGYKCCIPVGEQ